VQRLADIEDAIDKARDGQREDRIHVVPELEEREDAVGAAVAIAQAVAKAVEERIEVVVVNDEQAAAWMTLVVKLQVAGELQSHRRFARAFLAKDDRGGRLGRIAVDLVPGGMIGALDAEFLEDRISLRVFLRERIAGDAVVVEELLDLHGFRKALGFRL
jgi:hypothetical protein